MTPRDDAAVEARDLVLKAVDKFDMSWSATGGCHRYLVPCLPDCEHIQTPRPLGPRCRQYLNRRATALDEALVGFTLIPAANLAALRAELAAKDARLAELEAALGSLAKHLRNVCKELEAEIECRHSADLRANFPSEERRWRRDMDSVVRARVALQAASAAGREADRG